ncbi:MAG TPA: TPM domain-containing protein [Hanamia sp.]|nr:TPM domain-containing protein [Hanamia sp.]
MWPFRKKKSFFSNEENEQIVQSIKNAERQTSGELRIFVESRCKYVDPLDRAAELFSKLQMEKTALRNGVLFYVAVTDKQLAIFADTGIHAAAGEQYWKESVQQILSVFSKESVSAGIIASVAKIGHALKTNFPYDEAVDKNELPDEIIFGQ